MQVLLQELRRTREFKVIEKLARRIVCCGHSAWLARSGQETRRLVRNWAKCLKVLSKASKLDLLLSFKVEAAGAGSVGAGFQAFSDCVLFVFFSFYERVVS